MRTERWSELSAEQKVKCTEDGRSPVITQSIGSSRGVVWVSGWGVRPKDKTAVTIGIVTQEFPPRAQPRVPVEMFGVQVAGHQDRQPAAKSSVQVRYDQCAGRRKLCRKDFHRSTGQHNLYGNCHQVGEARHRYRVVSNTPPAFGLSVRWQT